MATYRVITYWTLTGNREFVDLGDQSYGEWIIYEDLRPKYHVSLFDQSESSQLIKGKLEKEGWTIEQLLQWINELRNVKLSLVSKPLIEIVISSKLRRLDLPCIPVVLLNSQLGQVSTDN